MITVTVTAITRLKEIQVDHPKDPVIRITVRDLDQSRLNFTITLEAAAHPDDAIQLVDGLTIAVDRRCLSWMDGVTLDYTSTEGFLFLHTEQERSSPILTNPTLN